MKDRPAYNILRNALQSGLIQPGWTVIESSSGNMGIGLAQACLYFDLNLICVIDPKTTRQNAEILQAYGARTELVSEPDEITGEYLPARIQRVHSLMKSMDNCWWADQYSNIDNAKAHYQTMDEILQATNGMLDYLFCATSTCGTLRGCADYLRDKGLAARVIAVDAVGSVIFQGVPQTRLVPGHGASIRPELFNEHLAERHIHVSDRECVVGCRVLLRREAILAGGSSGAIITALFKMRNDIDNEATCVAILPDRGGALFGDDLLGRMGRAPFRQA